MWPGLFLPKLTDESLDFKKCGLAAQAFYCLYLTKLTERG